MSMLKAKASVETGMSGVRPNVVIVPANPKPKKQLPAKPRPDFPLTAHRNGQWCKFITGAHKAGIPQPIMFGPWYLPDEAEKVYLKEKDDWEKGINPRTSPARVVRTTAATFEELAQKWLEYRESLVTTGDPEKAISDKSFSGSCNAVTALFRVHAKHSDPMRIPPQVWAEIRAKLREGVSPNTWNQRLVHIRAMCKWGKQVGLLPNLPTWMDPEEGDQFALVPLAIKQERRFIFQKDNGDRIFRLDLARKILRHAIYRVNALPDRFAEMRYRGGGGGQKEKQMLISSINMRACIFLAANTGCQGEDISGLADGDVDLETGWIDTLRKKTSVPWQAPLWPETKRFLQEAAMLRCPVWPEALEAWRAERVKYISDKKLREKEMKTSPLLVSADGFPLVHCTVAPRKSKARVGQGRNTYSDSNSIEQAFRKLLDGLGHKADGLNFCAWRPTFQTMAIATQSLVYIDRIFGHRIQGSRDPYVRFDYNDLEPVTSYVRNRLFDEEITSLVARTPPIGELISASGYTSAGAVTQTLYRQAARRERTSVSD